MMTQRSAAPEGNSLHICFHVSECLLWVYQRARYLVELRIEFLIWGELKKNGGVGFSGRVKIAYVWIHSEKVVL